MIAVYFFAACVIALAIFQVLKFVAIKQYLVIVQFQTYIELPLYLLSIVFVFVFRNDCGCPMNWQWQIGIFVLLLAWLNLGSYGANISLVGIYLLAFNEIGKTLLKLLLFALLLVVSISIIVFMMFYNPFAEVCW